MELGKSLFELTSGLFVHLRLVCLFVLQGLLFMVDKKTGKPDKAKAKPRFVKPVSYRRAG